MTTTDDRPQAAGAAASPFEVMLWLGDAVRRVGSGLASLTGAGIPEADAPAADVPGADVPGAGAGFGGGPVRLGEVLALVPTDELAGLFGDLVALRALAEGASAAVLAEAVARGVVAAADESPRPIGPKVTAWV